MNSMETILMITVLYYWPWVVKKSAVKWPMEGEDLKATDLGIDIWFINL